jgi:hypothetical protein
VALAKVHVVFLIPRPTRARRGGGYVRLCFGWAVAPLLTYFAVNQGMGFAKPMMYATIGSLVVYVVAVFLGPETKGKVMTADLEVIEVEVPA